MKLESVLLHFARDVMEIQSLLENLGFKRVINVLHSQSAIYLAIEFSISLKD